MNTPFSVLMAVYKNDRVDHFMLSVESVMSQNPAPDDLVVITSYSIHYTKLYEKWHARENGTHLTTAQYGCICNS